MASVTVRIPEELRDEMKKIKDINWSEVVRRAIAEEVRRVKMKRAAMKMDTLRARSKVKWDSVRVIRDWRERRR